MKPFVEYHEKLETAVEIFCKIKLVMVSKHLSVRVHVNLLAASYTRNFGLSKEKDSLVSEAWEESSSLWKVFLRGNLKDEVVDDYCELLKN